MIGQFYLLFSLAAFAAMPLTGPAVTILATGGVYFATASAASYAFKGLDPWWYIAAAVVDLVFLVAFLYTGSTKAGVIAAAMCGMGALLSIACMRSGSGFLYQWYPQIGTSIVVAIAMMVAAEAFMLES